MLCEGLHSTFGGDGCAWALALGGILMAKKPTYEELEREIVRLKKKDIKRKRAEKALRGKRGKIPDSFRKRP